MRIGKMGLAVVLIWALVAPAQTKPTSSNHVPATANAGDLKIAAAADLAPALESIITEFKKSQGGNVKVTYAASGTLAAQIEQGAAYDVFMSADLGYPKRLVEKKLADPKSLTNYTRGRMVLYILPSVPQDVTHAGLKSLTDPMIQKIAIANPEHSPYGRAAVAALTKAGVYDKIHSKVVLADNVGKAAEMVRSGSVQAAIIALSAMHDREMRRHGRVVEVDMSDYPPLEQAAVITKHGAKNPLAKVFIEYLGSQMARGYFARFGFMPPSTPATPATEPTKKSGSATDKKKPASESAPATPPASSPR